MNIFRLGTALVMSLAIASFGRIGPVSQYGQLQAGKSGGQGRIFGSCSAYSSTPVQVKGMSLFWSIDEAAAQFWTKTTIDGLVQKHGIQLIRAAMGVDENWGAGNYFSSTTYYAGLMDEVVQAAIDNDIYVIIDYHSHKANYDVASAKSFFSRMAEKWGGYDNVIFEIFNEPYCQRDASDECIKSGGNDVMITWSQVKTYANQVISTIRQYSDNLVIVGTPSWDQHPEDAINNEVTDSKHNTAYALHYYASSHGTWLQSNGTKAINAGLPLFVSEWGTIYASGRGEVGTANGSWQTWMNNNYLSSANWSVANKYEGKVEDDGTYVGGDGQGGSYFADGFVPASATGIWSYSTSGEWINSNYLVWKNGTKTESLSTKTYTACSGGSVIPTYSSSSVKPASSASAPIIVDGDDILQGKGMFAGCSSVLGCGWTTNIKKFTNYTTGYTGSIELQENNDGDQVLGFWTNNRPIEEWELQVTHNVTLPMGYAYQIVGGGYMYEGTNGDVAIGVVTGSKSDEFVFGISQELDGYFESDVYENCDANISGKFYINAGGLTGTQALTTGGYGGGMAIQEVKILATPINCGGPVITSSASVKPNSSASINPTSSAGSASAPDVDVIDDMEDGDNIPYTPGFWMAYNDNGSVDDRGYSPRSSIGNPVVGDDCFGNTIYQVVFPSISSSKYAAGLKGIVLDAGKYEYDPYVDLVLELDSNGAYDLSSCTSIKYNYKGADHLFKVVMYNDYAGAVTDFNYHKTSKAASSSWTTATISWTSLAQESGWGTKAALSKAKVGRFVWEVRDDTYNYLYVDNVRCVGTTINKGQVANSSNSVQPKSSSSIVKPTSSSTFGPASSNSTIPMPFSSAIVATSSESTTFIGNITGKLAASYSITKADDYLQITSKNNKSFKVEVFDVMGNVVTKARAIGNISIPTDNMLDGTYLVRISGKSGIMTTKVIVK